MTRPAPHPDQRPRTHRRAIRVAVLDTDGRILLMQDSDPLLEPPRRWWITPGGGVEVGESDPQTAVRELAEEADLRALEWHTLVDYYTTPGGSSEAIRVFLARQIEEIPDGERHTRQDEEAAMPLVWVGLDEVTDAVLDGRVHNPSTVVAVLAMLALAVALGGWWGLGLFVWQAFVAIWQLELTNYVEHYGLSRKHLGDGRYEPVRPRHSWNASHKATNWLLINLQRHSDHHVKPDRRFPLLHTHGSDQAPQLPFGYPAMTIMAMVPPLWRRRMNPRVRAWRRQFYPEVTDWGPYNRGELPMPRNAL